MNFNYQMVAVLLILIFITASGSDDNQNLSDLCGLSSLIQNNGLGGAFNVFQNLYNPTITGIQNASCII